ncbi:hypothetical protein RCZ04_19900 [Capnocytophaga sp. HP1101]
MKFALFFSAFCTIVLNHCHRQPPAPEQTDDLYCIVDTISVKKGVQARWHYTDTTQEYAKGFIVNYSDEPIEINSYYIFRFGLQYEYENGKAKDIQGCPPPSVPPANLDDCKVVLQKGERYNFGHHIKNKMSYCQDIVNFDKPTVKIRASIHYKYPNDKKHNMVYTNWIVYKKAD